MSHKASDGCYDATSGEQDVRSGHGHQGRFGRSRDFDRVEAASSAVPPCDLAVDGERASPQRAYRDREASLREAREHREAGSQHDGAVYHTLRRAPASTRKAV